MKIPLFFNNTARSARAGRFRRWLDRHRDFFDVIEPAKNLYGCRRKRSLLFGG